MTEKMRNISNKGFTFIIAAGLLTIFAFSGCGKEQKKQAEIIQTFEESFAVNAMQDSAESSTTFTERPRAGSMADETPRDVAQDVVRMIDSGDYVSAVAKLDQMMRTPGLTPDQWIASRNAMAEVQRRLVTDPNISDAEKARAREALERN